MRRRTVATVLALIVAALLAGCAVTPAVQWQRSSFEGFNVISYVPEQPRGMAYVFHGSNGSATFADRIETTDAINRLVAKGYGFVSTSSTDTGNKRWNAADPSLTANPDLARLGRLQAHLVATTGLAATTPLVGVGMSNGARFVTLWGQAWRNGGYPVKASWASHGHTATPFAGQGQLRVPTVFSTSEHDFTVRPVQVIQAFATARDAGTPTEYAFYATMYAIAGVVVSRQEDLQASSTPLTLVLVGSYLLVFPALEDPSSTLAVVASIVPFCSPIVMPARVALGEAAPLEMVVSLGLLMVSVALLLRVGARIYERSILRMGSPAKLSEVLRLAR